MKGGRIARIQTAKVRKNKELDTIIEKNAVKPPKDTRFSITSSTFNPKMFHKSSLSTAKSVPKLSPKKDLKKKKGG